MRRRRNIGGLERRIERIKRERRELAARDTVGISEWTPTPKQREFLELPFRYALIGGGAGSSKTAALTFAVSEHIAYPRYRALICGQTDTALKAPGGVIDNLRGMYPNARISETERVIRFHSGARIHWLGLPDSVSHFRAQGQQYHFIGIDEAGQIHEDALIFLPSRLRKSANDPIPLRFRLTANPGGLSGAWLKQHYVDTPNEGDADTTRHYMPTTWRDNPHMDDSYGAAFGFMSDVQRRQLEYGDWDAVGDSMLNIANLIDYTGEAPCDWWIRAWDLAATPNGGDYTVGALVGMDNRKNLYIADIQRAQLAPDGVENLVRTFAEADGAGVAVLIEQEGGASGASLISHYERSVLGDLPGVYLDSFRPTGPKTERAAVLGGLMGQGRVFIRKNLAGKRELLNEMARFPDGLNDDQVDAVGMAAIRLTGAG